MRVTEKRIELFTKHSIICPLCNRRIASGEIEQTEYIQSKGQDVEYFHRDCYKKNFFKYIKD